MDLVNILLSLTAFIPYHLALAFINVSIKFKNTILPGLALCFLSGFSKVVFNAPPIFQTIIIMLLCAFLLHLFNKVDFILSVIGSLLSYTTIILSSLLIVCPVLLKIGFQVPKETNGIAWIFLNLAEIFIPALVLITLKISKITPVKYISRI